MGAAVGGLTGQGGKVLEMLNKGDVAGLSGMLERGELSQRAVMDMMVRGSGGRINEAQAISAFRATDANTENIFQGGFGGTVRQMQGADIFRTRITPAISNALMESGISQEKAMGLAERISMRLRETPRETLATPELRNAAMSRILREEGVAGDARKLGGISETMWSQMTSMVQDQLKSYGSLANLFAEHDPRATRGGAAQVQEATKQSLIQSALAGVGQGGVMQRMLQTLGSSEMGKDPEAIKKLLLKSLGYEDIGKAGAKQPLKSELEAVEKASGALARIGEIKEQITARTADVTKRLTDAFGHGTAEEIKRLTEERENITKSYSAEIAEQTKILESDQSKGMVEKIKERAKEEAKLKDTAEGKVTPEEKLTKMVITGTLDVDADGKGKLSATGTSDGPAASPIA
jgi:histone H3/H4